MIIIITSSGHSRAEHNAQILYTRTIMIYNIIKDTFEIESGLARAVEGNAQKTTRNCARIRAASVRCNLSAAAVAQKNGNYNKL